VVVEVIAKLLCLIPALENSWWYRL
jgi:hypothetical protein